MRVASLFALLAASATAFQVVDDVFLNDNVIRTIDMSSAMVREKRAIAIVRRDGKQTPTYYLAIELPKQMENATVSLVTVKEKDSDKTLPISFYGSDESFAERFNGFFAIPAN